MTPGMKSLIYNGGFATLCGHLKEMGIKGCYLVFRHILAWENQ